MFTFRIACRSQGYRTRYCRCRRQWRFPQFLLWHPSLPSEGERSVLWLVDDEGVYILSNGKPAEGQKALVIHSEECHPVGNPDWWDYQRRWFGTDAGIEIDANQLVPLFGGNSHCTHLQVRLTEDSVSLGVTRR